MERDALDEHPDAVLFGLTFAACLLSPRRHGLAGAFLAAATAVLVRRAALRRASPSWALHCALLYGLASYALSLGARGLSAGSFAHLGLALGLLGLLGEGPEWSAAAGAGFALAGLSRPEGAFFAAAAAAYLLFHRRDRLAAFAAGAAVLAGAVRAYHPRLAAESAFPGGVSAGRLLAALLSPERGLLFYFPAAAFGVWGAVKAGRDPRARWAPYLAAACAATWVYLGRRASWTAGDSFGAPGFSLVCLALAVLAAEPEREVLSAPRLRRAWAAAFAFGVLVHASGAYVRRPADGLTLIEREERLWSPGAFPLAAAFADDGPMGGTPQPWRSVYALALLGVVFVPVERWSRRRLERDAAALR